MADRRARSSRFTIEKIDLCKVSIAFACVATVALKNWSFVVYVAQAFMILMVLSKCSRAKRMPSIRLYLASYGFFACWCIVSVFWAVDPSRVLSASVGIVQFVVLGACIAIYSQLEEDPDYIIDCLAWASLVLIAVLVVLTPASAWTAATDAMTDAASSSNRIGGSVGYHPNALGYVCVASSVIWLYKYMKDGKRAIALVPVILLCIIIVFTKSRLSIVVVVACMALFGLLLSKGFLRRSAVLALLLLIAALVFWAILNVPMIYQIVGFRFEAMLGLSGSVDASTETRSEMISIALQLFSEHPLVGVGFENFSYYYFYSYGGWAMTYAHSNFAELLADLGLPGLISYYLVPIWTLYTLIKNRKGAVKRELHALLTALCVCLLAADYASISYTNDFIHIFWAASYAYALGLRRLNAADSDSGSAILSRKA